MSSAIGSGVSALPFYRLYRVRRAREELEHRRKVGIGRFLEAVEFPPAAASLALLIAPGLDERAETRAKRGVERLDQDDEVEVLRGPEIEADLLHDDLAGGPANQHIMVRQVLEMPPKGVETSHSPACPSRASLAPRYDRRCRRAGLAIGTGCPPSQPRPAAGDRRSRSQARSPCRPSSPADRGRSASRSPSRPTPPPPAFQCVGSPGRCVQLAPFRPTAADRVHAAGAGSGGACARASADGDGRASTAPRAAGRTGHGGSAQRPWSAPTRTLRAR